MPHRCHSKLCPWHTEMVGGGEGEGVAVASGWCCFSDALSLGISAHDQEAVSQPDS